MVLGQHGELGAFLRGGTNELGCFVEVEVGVQGLEGKVISREGLQFLGGGGNLGVELYESDFVI